MIKRILLTIISILKKYIDKLYYNYYTYNRETLIREMFPWITKVWEYEKLNEYIVSHSLQEITMIASMLTSYYWWEANSLILKNREEDIKYLKWILDLALTLERFKEANLTENNSSI